MEVGPQGSSLTLLSLRSQAGVLSAGTLKVLCAGGLEMGMARCPVATLSPACVRGHEGLRSSYTCPCPSCAPTGEGPTHGGPEGTCPSSECTHALCLQSSHHRPALARVLRA